jgi:hypothetical protein
MTDRHTCEGTRPRIVIGHRVYKRACGTRYVSRPWTAQWSYQGKAYFEALQTFNKQAALRKAHAIHERIHAGEVNPPKRFKLSMQELADAYL